MKSWKEKFSLQIDRLGRNTPLRDFIPILFECLGEFEQRIENIESKLIFKRNDVSTAKKNTKNRN